MHNGWNENRALLRGRVAEAPTFSHENHDVTYWMFPLEVKRLSGAADRVNVLLPGTLLSEQAVTVGMGLSLEGEIRSFNNRSGQGSRLIISFYVKSMTPWSGEDVNQLILAGVLCKPPIFRRTPLGREICDLMLAVNRKYGRADYLPCITWGTLAQRCAEFQVGDSVRIEGRFQSRKYNKVENGESSERIAYEISVMKLERVSEEEMEE